MLQFQESGVQEPNFRLVETVIVDYGCSSIVIIGGLRDFHSITCGRTSHGRFALTTAMVEPVVTD